MSIGKWWSFRHQRLPKAKWEIARGGMQGILEDALHPSPGFCCMLWQFDTDNSTFSLKRAERKQLHMRFGLALPNVGRYSDIATLVDLAFLAESDGWDGIFLWDTLHYQADSQEVCDPWIALTALALNTERIHIGTMVTALTRRRPWKVARETATLDRLSGGRLIFGVGAGDEGDKGFTHFGEEQDSRTRAKLLDESLDILNGLWSGEPFSYSGEHYQVQKITFLPTPLQQPRIPVWIAGTWPRTGPMLRAARWDGVNAFAQREDGTFGEILPEEVVQLRAFMDEHRESDLPLDIVVSSNVFAAYDDEDAQALLIDYKDAGVSWCLQSVWPETDPEDVRTGLQRGRDTWYKYSLRE
ncbi:Luciferase-like, subgroup [Ktedonobacter racemifer DSM 44963]|uniref:Luciferase-like, subgroup n=2 Tax=Ktedonobacter racemifer TaxID=363277 RepID=D6TGW0_KTERA|nr:Luciferase-like, subgroup [Ktedonobacter racemifer DSM 44963]